MRTDYQLNFTDQLSRYFPSESLLQQALAGLLVRMPETWGVQILQGTQELGKDLVFYIRGGFGESLLCACVVKNKRVTGEVAKSEGARTILFQAQQAFDSPHVDASGKEILIERVYVITPFPLSPTTISSIKGALRERAGQVIFIGGSELFDLFKQYWPDFLADEADAIQKHLADTSKTYEADNPIAKIASQYHLGNVDASVKKIYVPQELHRDVYSYMLGPIIQDAILKPDLLLNDWNRSTLEAELKHLHQLEQALPFLEEWGYVDSKLLNSTDGVLNSISLFKSLLKESWLEEIKRKYKTNFKSYEVVETDASALPLAPQVIQTNANALKKLLGECLQPLTSVLELVNSIVASPHENDIKRFSEETFQASCHLDDCAHTAPYGLFRQQGKMTVNLPTNVLETWNRSLMIVGAPGYGKTSFCRWHALQDVEKYSANNSNILPVYHPLHRFANQELGSFEDTFLSVLGKSALLVNDETSTAKASTIRVRIYLDGLDEIPSEVTRQKLLKLVRDNVEGHEKFQIVLTARDFVRGPWLNWLPRVHLSGFTDKEITNLISQWFAKSEKEAETFIDQLQKVPTLSGLMKTPLLATLIILVFKQTGRLPENKTRLYGIFVDLMSGGWDLTKSVLRESKFGQAVKEMVLTSLARRQHELQQREFSDDDILAAMEGNLSKAFLKQWEVFRNELVADGLISRSADIYQFSHLSFQEFLTAKSFIGDTRPRGINEALAAYLDGGNWWREVIHFYIGLMGKPKETISWLITEVDSFQSLKRRTPVRQQVNYLLRSIRESYPLFPIEDSLFDTPFRSF